MRKEIVGFIGAGNMAEAIAGGILESRLYDHGSLWAADIAEERRNLFKSMGINVTGDNNSVVAACDVLIIAVKPQNLSGLLSRIGTELTEKHLLITICAGVPTARFEAAASAPVRVVRVMPNTPLQVRMGATALCAGRHATEGDMALAAEIFAAAGKVVRVEEALMNTVTALSGSGPAYFFTLVETLIEAGRRQGLSEEIARELVIQTARGAGEMMALSDAPPDELCRTVTSKGGTTEAALRRMEQGKIRETMIAAVAAAVRRAQELADG